MLVRVVSPHQYVVSYFGEAGDAGLIDILLNILAQALQSLDGHQLRHLGEPFVRGTGRKFTIDELLSE